MQEKPTIFGNLWARRVPHIVGIYIAAVWMAVEIGDWVIERFGLPPNLTAYIFVGMIAMLPAVIVVAYGHGAPGKDRWVGFEKIFLALNLVVAGGALLMVNPQSNSSAQGTGESQTALLATKLESPKQASVTAATEMVTFTDDAGAEQEMMVAREGFHKTIGAFFLEHDNVPAEDYWLAYGLTWLLRQDLRRSPLLSVVTPFDSARMQEQLRSKGIDRGLAIPRPLALQIARERGFAAALFGRYARSDDGNLMLSIELIDPETSEVLGDPIVREGEDWLDLVDQVAVEVRKHIATQPDGEMIAINDLRLRDHVSSNLTAIETMIDGLASVAFDNDYQLGITKLSQAVELDPSFADANAELAMMYRLSGQSGEALAATAAALKYDYKLYSETKFILQAIQYAIRGESDKVMQSLQLLTEVHPSSAEAFDLLGESALVFGQLDRAENAVRRVLELDPADYQQLLNLARIQTLRGDLEGAQSWTEAYLEQRPTDQRAWSQLAGNKIRRGLLGQARQDYERLTLIDSNSLAGELGLAKLDIREGKLDSARSRLTSLLGRADTDQQQVEVLGVYSQLHSVTGELELVIDTLRKMDQLASSYEVPVNRAFLYGFSLAVSHAEIGQFDQARAELDRMVEDLDPPLDGYIELGHMMVSEKSEDKDRYAEALAAMKSLNQRFHNPVMQPFLDAGDAQLAIWDGNFQQSASILTDVIEELSSSFLNADSIEPLEAQELKLAQCLRMAGRTDEARSKLDQVLQRFPAWPVAKLELTELLIDQQRVEDAAAQLGEVLSLWSEADSDYKEYQRAQSLRARLQAL